MSFHASVLAVLALSAIAGAPPAAAAVGEAGSTGSPLTLDHLPPTRDQASADFRRSPGGRARRRWKSKRRSNDLR